MEPRSANQLKADTPRPTFKKIRIALYSWEKLESPSIPGEKIRIALYPTPHYPNPTLATTRDGAGAVKKFVRKTKVGAKRTAPPARKTKSARRVASRVFK